MAEASVIREEELSSTSGKQRVRKEDDNPPPSSDQGRYCHPIWKQLALQNGEINRMTKLQIKEKLAELQLDTRGVKEVLKKRLKNHYRKRKLQAAKLKPVTGEPNYDYILVIDFEATCQESNPSDFKYEIIEFPVVLIDTWKQEVVDYFHSYVKPELNPQLSTFCTTLTGISQNVVDKSPSFPTVLERMNKWMASHELGDKHSFAVATDGPWDMSRFLFTQCKISSLPFPRWAKRWINIRKAFSNYYGFRRAKLSAMLENMGMTFEGQQHSGIDDSRNIARIVVRMLCDGCELKTNERLHASKARHNVTNSGEDLDSSVEPIIRQPGQDSEEDSELDADSFNAEDSFNCNHNPGNSTCTDCLLAKEVEKRLLIGKAENLQTNSSSSGDKYVSTTNSMDAEVVDKQQDEKYEDLLAYYALQKS